MTEGAAHHPTTEATYERRSYRSPSNAFIADFIGTSNFFNGEVMRRVGTSAEVKLKDGVVLNIPDEAGVGVPGGSIPFFVRPENLFLAGPGDRSGDDVPGRVLHVSYAGAVSHCYVDIGLAQPVDVLLTNTDRASAAALPGAGDPVRVRWVPGSLTVLQR